MTRDQIIDVAVRLAADNVCVRSGDWRIQRRPSTIPFSHHVQVRACHREVGVVVMNVYQPVRWKCPKCGMRSHTAHYIQHDDTITVACTHCHYWESRLPKDRVVQ